MKNLVRCLGIAALAAAVVLTMTACGPDNTEAPPGEVSILKSVYGEHYTNKPLVAKYTGDEAVYYYWYSYPTKPIDNPLFDQVRTQAINANSDLTLTEYTPTDAKFYQVAAADKAGVDKLATNPNATVDAKWSEVVEVKTAPAYVEFCGTWKTTAQFQPADSPAGTKAHETIVITNGSFKLDSSYTPPTKAGNPVAPDTTNEGNEHIYWTINSTTTLTPLPTGYTDGLVLNVTATSVRGYTAFTTFNIYRKADGNTFLMRRTNGSQVEITRDYKRQ